MSNIIALKDLNVSEFNVSNKIVSNQKYKNVSYSDIIDALSIDGVGLQAYLLSHYGGKRMIVRDTFNYNMSILWNRNIMKLVEKVVDSNILDEIMQDEAFLELSKINETTTSDGTDETTKTETDITDRDTHKTEMFDTLSKGRKADNPNTTTGDLLSEFVSEADEVVGDGTSEVLDDFTETRTRTSSDSQEHSKSDIREYTEQANRLTKTLELFNNYPSLSLELYGFLNNFKPLFLPMWYDG